MEMDLTDSSAIVTGGASGLGLAAARRLHDAGAEVIVLDRPDDDASSRAQHVAAIGERAHFHGGDVTVPEDVAAAVERAVSRAPLRAAVSCAGIAAPGRLVSRRGVLDSATFMQVLAVNTAGTMHLMAHAAEAMQANELQGEDRGVLISTASIAAFEGQIGQIAYSASKGAVASMTLPAARELASSQIRVVTIAPGLFETPMMAGLPEEVRASLAETTPHPARLGRPEDYALAVEQILANPMLNGEVIRLDGAVRLQPR